MHNRGHNRGNQKISGNDFHCTGWNFLLTFTALVSLPLLNIPLTLCPLPFYLPTIFQSALNLQPNHMLHHHCVSDKCYKTLFNTQNCANLCRPISTASHPTAAGQVTAAQSGRKNTDQTQEGVFCGRGYPWFRPGREKGKQRRPLPYINPPSQAWKPYMSLLCSLPAIQLV